jgi:hypothetical protein
MLSWVSGQSHYRVVRIVSGMTSETGLLHYTALPISEPQRYPVTYGRVLKTTTADARPSEDEPARMAYVPVKHAYVADAP